MLRVGFLSTKSQVMLELFVSYSQTYEVKFVYDGGITIYVATKKTDSVSSCPISYFVVPCLN